MAKKNEAWPQHKMGKRCGYDLNEDGSIRVASRYSDEFSRIADEQAALDEFLASITRVSQPMAKAIAEARRKWWADMCEDYGLEIENLQYNPATRTVRASKGKGSDHG